MGFLFSFFSSTNISIKEEKDYAKVEDTSSPSVGAIEEVGCRYSNFQAVNSLSAILVPIKNSWHE